MIIHSDDEFKRVSDAILRACTPDELRAARLERAEYAHRKLPGYDAVQEMGEIMWHRENANRKRALEEALANGRVIAQPSAAKQRLAEIRKTALHCDNDVPSIIASYQRCIRLIRELSFSDPDERNEADHSIRLLDSRVQSLKQEMSVSAFSD